MRGFIFLCVLLYLVRVHAFGTCENDTDCPDNAECVVASECNCKEGFDIIDLPDITFHGNLRTICIDLGYCSPFDNNIDDCINGQCTIYKDKYGSFQTICVCRDGFYGEKCDSTTQKSGSAVNRGRYVLLVLIAGVAALLSSSIG